MYSIDLDKPRWFDAGDPEGDPRNFVAYQPAPIVAHQDIRQGTPSNFHVWLGWGGPEGDVARALARTAKPILHFAGLRYGSAGWLVWHYPDARDTVNRIVEIAREIATEEAEVRA